MRHEWMQAGYSGGLAVLEERKGAFGTSCDWGDGELRPCSPDVVDWMPEMARLAEENRAQAATLETMGRRDGDHLTRIAALEAELGAVKKATVQVMMERIREVSALRDRVRILEAEVERLRGAIVQWNAGNMSVGELVEIAVVRA